MTFDKDVPIINLPDKEIQRQFDKLQKKLIPLWKSMDHLTQDEQSIVVIPSLTVDYPLQGSVLQAYEERFLFLLLLLRQPRARIIYVTSQVILPSIVEYYLGLLRGVIASHARQRLLLFTPQDGAPQPLSLKLLKRPRIKMPGRVTGGAEVGDIVAQHRLSGFDERQYSLQHRDIPTVGDLVQIHSQSSSWWPQRAHSLPPTASRVPASPMASWAASRSLPLSRDRQFLRLVGNTITLPGGPLPATS